MLGMGIIKHGYALISDLDKLDIFVERLRELSHVGLYDKQCNRQVKSSVRWADSCSLECAGQPSHRRAFSNQSLCYHGGEDNGEQSFQA